MLCRANPFPQCLYSLLLPPRLGSLPQASFLHLNIVPSRFIKAEGKPTGTVMG